MKVLKYFQFLTEKLHLEDIFVLVILIFSLEWYNIIKTYLLANWFKMYQIHNLKNK